MVIVNESPTLLQQVFFSAQKQNICYYSIKSPVIVGRTSAKGLATPAEMPTQSQDFLLPQGVAKMYLLKIDHITTPGSWDNPDQPAPEVESDYINLDNVVSITPIIDHHQYQLRIAFTSGDNGIYDVPPWVYDNVLRWLDKAVVCDGGVM